MCVCVYAYIHTYIFVYIFQFLVLQIDFYSFGGPVFGSLEGWNATEVKVTSICTQLSFKPLLCLTFLYDAFLCQLLALSQEIYQPGWTISLTLFPPPSARVISHNAFALRGVSPHPARRHRRRQRWQRGHHGGRHQMAPLQPDEPPGALKYTESVCVWHVCQRGHLHHQRWRGQRSLLSLISATVSS